MFRAPGAEGVGVDMRVLGTPEAAISGVAAAVDPIPETVVAHLSGALGVDVLAPHERRAACHPLPASALNGQAFPVEPYQIRFDSAMAARQPARSARLSNG